MNRLSWNSLGIFSLFFLAACTVGPDFKRPAAPTDKAYSLKGNPSHFGSQVVNSKKTVGAAWWEEFSSPELNEVLARGVKNNYNLAAMRQTFEQAKELVNAAKGPLWPQASLTAAVGKQKYGVALFGPTNFSIPPFTYYEVGPTLSYVVDIFGGTRRAIEKQQALANYQEQELKAAYLTLTGNIVSTALTIGTLNTQIEITQALISVDREVLRLTHKALILGSVSRLDELNAQNQLVKDETLLPLLYQQVKVNQDALNALVGSSAAAWEPPVFKLDHFKLPHELPLSLPSQLARTRPDINAAEFVLHAANADVGIATANLYPNITLTATMMQEALTPANLFRGSANAWSYLANSTTPLFNGGQLRAQKRAAMHAYEAAYANYQQIVLQAFLQVTDVLSALKQDAAEMSARQRELTVAKSTLKLTRLAYAEGSLGILDLLAAKRLYLQSRLDFTQAKAQRYQDTAQLYLALGGSHH